MLNAFIIHLIKLCYQSTTLIFDNNIVLSLMIEFVQSMSGTLISPVSMTLGRVSFGCGNFCKASSSCCVGIISWHCVFIGSVVNYSSYSRVVARSSLHKLTCVQHSAQQLLRAFRSIEL